MTEIKDDRKFVIEVGTEEIGPLGKAKVIGHIEVTVCPACFLYNENQESHHRDQHGPNGCNFCDCPKKNLRLPQIKPNNKTESIK